MVNETGPIDLGDLDKNIKGIEKLTKEEIQKIVAEKFDYFSSLIKYSKNKGLQMKAYKAAKGKEGTFACGLGEEGDKIFQNFMEGKIKFEDIPVEYFEPKYLYYRLPRLLTKNNDVLGPIVDHELEHAESSNYGDIIRNSREAVLHNLPVTYVGMLMNAFEDIYMGKKQINKGRAKRIGVLNLYRDLYATTGRKNLTRETKADQFAMLAIYQWLKTEFSEEFSVKLKVDKDIQQEFNEFLPHLDEIVDTNISNEERIKKKNSILRPIIDKLGKQDMETAKKQAIRKKIEDKRQKQQKGQLESNKRKTVDDLKDNLGNNSQGSAKQSDNSQGNNNQGDCEQCNNAQGNNNQGNSKEGNNNQGDNNTGSNEQGNNNKGDNNQSNNESGNDMTGDNNQGNNESGNDKSGNNNQGNEESGNDKSGNDNQSNNESGNDKSGDNNQSNNESGNDKSGNDKQGNNESGNDKSGNDKQLNNESGNDKSGDNNQGNNESGNDKSGNDKQSNNESGNDKSGNDKQLNNESGNDKSGNDKQGGDETLGEDDHWDDDVDDFDDPETEKEIEKILNEMNEKEIKEMMDKIKNEIDKKNIEEHGKDLGVQKKLLEKNEPKSIVDRIKDLFNSTSEEREEKRQKKKEEEELNEQQKKMQEQWDEIVDTVKKREENLKQEENIQKRLDKIEEDSYEKDLGKMEKVQKTLEEMEKMSEKIDTDDIRSRLEKRIENMKEYIKQKEEQYEREIQKSGFTKEEEHLYKEYIKIEQEMEKMLDKFIKELEKKIPKLKEFNLEGGYSSGRVTNMNDAGKKIRLKQFGERFYSRYEETESLEINLGICLSIDNSGSMEINLEETTKLVVFLGLLCERWGIPFHVNTFDDSLNIIKDTDDDFTSKKGKLMKELYANGGTNMGVAVKKDLMVLKEVKRTHPDTVFLPIFITDGEANIGITGPELVELIKGFNGLSMMVGIGIQERYLKRWYPDSKVIGLNDSSEIMSKLLNSLKEFFTYKKSKIFKVTSE